MICAVATQGAGFGSGNEHVKEYYLEYSRDGIYWQLVLEHGSLKVLFDFRILNIFLCNKLTSVFLCVCSLIDDKLRHNIAKVFRSELYASFQQSNNLIIFVDHRCLFRIGLNCICFFVIAILLKF